MTRGLLAAAILGLSALPAAAGDNYAPYPGCGSCNTCAAAPQYGWHAGVNRNATCGTCNACGDKGDRGERWQKFKDFLCYKPTIPCDSRPRPTPYIPPLTAWFPCHSSGPCSTCDSGCAATGILGRRIAPCGSCNGGAANAGPAMLGMPSVQQTVPRGPAPMYYTTLARPVAAVTPTTAPQSYSVTKAAYSYNVQASSLPTRPPTYLPGAYGPQQGNNWLPRN